MTRAGWLSVALACALGFSAFQAYQYHTDRTLAEVDPDAQTLLLGASNLARWPERAPDSYSQTFGPHPQNLAKRAWTTVLMLQNLPLSSGASRIVVDLGGSDLRHDGRTPLDTALGIAGVVESLRVSCPSAQIVVLAVLPLPGLERQAEETNLWARDLLAGEAGVVWVPVYLGLEEGLRRDDPYRHPSEAGYRELAAQIGEVLGDSGLVAVSP